MKTIAHPQLLISNAVELCRRDRTLAAYLGLIELTQRFNAGRDQLASVWQETRPHVLAQLSSTANVDVLMEWLAKRIFLPQDQMRWIFFPYATDSEYELGMEQLLAGSDADKDKVRIASSFLDMARLEISENNEDISNIQDEGRSYAAFRPAWEIEELLQEHFPESEVQDPAVVIGRYIRRIFPAITPPEPALHWHSEDEMQIIDKSWIHDSISELCLSSCLFLRTNTADLGNGNHSADGLELLFQEISAISKSSRRDMVEGKDMLEKLRVICRSPQPLLSSLLRAQRWTEFESDASEVLQILTGMPWGTDRVILDSKEFVSHEDLGGTTRAQQLASMPWPVAANIVEQMHLNGNDEQIFVGVKRLLGIWLATTKRHDMGRSPLSADKLPLAILQERHFVWEWGSVDIDSWNNLTKEFGGDFWFLVGLLQSSGYALMGLSCYSDVANVAFHRNRFLSIRPEIYLQIVEAASREGLEELANAFLAFGIFSQSLAGYSVAGWPKRRLSKLVANSESAPGGAMVRRAIIVAASVATSKEHALNKMWLSSLSIGTSIPDIAPRPIGLSRSEIERLCQTAIGEECWLWLFPKTKNYIIEAELTYSRCHLDIGTGILDLGTLTVGYCKAVESELTERFSEFFSSVDFREYKRKNNLRGPPTFGTVTYLLDHFNELDSSLQTLMRKLRLLAHMDGELVNWLSFLKNVRNNAAHPRKVDLSNFVEVRRLSVKIYPRLKARLT